MNSNEPEARSDREAQTVVPTTRARQGVTGHNVRYVLLAGTVGAVVLLSIVYVIYFS